MKTIAIRVSDDDHKLFADLAARELMPLSVLIRRLVHAHAVSLALIPDPAAEARRALQPEKTAGPAKPEIERRPIPTIPNAWREEIMRRVDTGERIADVAESYGVSVDVAKQKYRSAKDEADAKPTPKLVYAPVDPDNPTEAEQKANADIARQKLVDMGLL